MNLVLKLVWFSVTLILADLYLESLDYSSIYQPIIVSIVLAIVGVFMERSMLSDHTFWRSLIADYITAVVIVYASGFFLPNAAINIYGAMYGSAFLGLMEYIMHRWLLRTDRINQSPA